MATSDSEDFESADEDLDLERPAQRGKTNESTSDCEEKKQVVFEDTADVKPQMPHKEENIAVDENKRGKRSRNERPVRQPREPKSGGMKKLGTRIPANKTETETKYEVRVEETFKEMSITDQQSQLKGETKQVTVPSKHSNPPEEKGELQNDIHESKPENNVTQVLDKLGDTSDNNKNEGSESTPSWGGWGNWGVTSLISTATESVSTLTSHVSQEQASDWSTCRPDKLHTSLVSDNVIENVAEEHP